ncbi:Uncharacterised protein [Klebsiella pneumoniae]|nr:Uncharacterised protein [Klebsiella pneumoniae]
MAPVLSSPAALRLPGLGYMGLREAPVGRIRRSRHPAQRREWHRWCPPRRRCACRAWGICACGVPEIMLLICNPINPGKAFVALISAHIALPVNRLRYAWHGAGSAQGAASRRRPLYPGLRPAKSPLRGPFDLSLQASGRAEAASVQNTALSPHPCGLPRPSGNVSAILRPQHRQFQQQW